MSYYIRIHKILTILLSISIVIYSVFLLKYDNWSKDLFYYTELFSLVVIIHYFFYNMTVKELAIKSHLPFCSFPLTRFSIIWFELKEYFKRVDIHIFIASTLWLIGYFYFISGGRIVKLILGLTLYATQLLFLVLFLIVMKNITKSFRDFVSLFISLSVLLTVFSEKNAILMKLFLLNPFNVGFLSMYSEKNLIIPGYIALFITIGVSALYGFKRLKVWPILKTF